jgi:hypothetical protein
MQQFDYTEGIILYCGCGWEVYDAAVHQWCEFKGCQRTAKHLLTQKSNSSTAELHFHIFSRFRGERCFVWFFYIWWNSFPSLIKLLPEACFIRDISQIFYWKLDIYQRYILAHVGKYFQQSMSLAKFETRIWSHDVKGKTLVDKEHKSNYNYIVTITTLRRIWRYQREIIRK